MELPNHPFYIGVQFHPRVHVRQESLISCASSEAAQTRQEMAWFRRGSLWLLACVVEHQVHFWKLVDVSDLGLLMARSPQ